MESGMESARYAPPRAAVGDRIEDSGVTQPVRVWPTRGRLGRLRLFVWNCILYLVFLAAITVVVFVLPQDGLVMTIASGILYVAYIAVFFSFLVQRSHDLGSSGWWSLLVFIPLVYLYWQFKAGTPGDNAYGPPPEPNSQGLKVAAWVLGVLFALFIGLAVIGGGIAGYTAARAQQGASR